ncbi:hypothetical protein B0T22DRAFT_41509 [Podospora appendiculata]|uniref:Uncharacterized protein n=1 Tax=Podospora appendiculata TaxID=314037 RepID=A0AAE0XHT1_9PEZI|nr:hypothetical protein B0T22DRAFT_41509 [Podospora appendiculata]
MAERTDGMDDNGRWTKGAGAGVDPSLGGPYLGRWDSSISGWESGASPHPHSHTPLSLAPYNLGNWTTDHTSEGSCDSSIQTWGGHAWLVSNWIETWKVGSGKGATIICGRDEGKHGRICLGGSRGCAGILGPGLDTTPKSYQCNLSWNIPQLPDYNGKPEDGGFARSDETALRQAGRAVGERPHGWGMETRQSVVRGAWWRGDHTLGRCYPASERDGIEWIWMSTRWGLEMTHSFISPCLHPASMHARSKISTAHVPE